jgi:hypothetical protein
MLDLRDRSLFAYQEGGFRSYLTDAPEEVDKLQLTYDQLVALALPPDDSVAFIESVMEESYPCLPPLE